MLAKSYKLAVANNTGVTIPAEMIDVLYEERFITHSLENHLKSQRVALENAAQLTDGSAVALGAAQSNDEHPVELEGVLQIQFGGLSPSGTFSLYYMPSGDGGTTFPDILNSFEVLQYTVSTGGTHKVAFFV